MYSKPGCHLCGIAKEVILSVQKEIDFKFTETDIEKNQELFSQYKDDIPVIYINASFFAKYNVNREEFIKRLNDDTREEN